MQKEETIGIAIRQLVLTVPLLTVLFSSCVVPPSNSPDVEKTVLRIELKEPWNQTGATCDTRPDGGYDCLINSAGASFGAGAEVIYRDGSTDEDTLLATSDSSVAKIDGTDTVVAVAEGKATISVRARQDPSIQAEIRVTVDFGGGGRAPVGSGPLTGTFLQLFNDEVAALGDPTGGYLDGWREEFGALRDIGIDTVVIQYGTYRDEDNAKVVWYQDRGTLYSDLFAAAEEMEIEVFLGLAYDGTWSTYDPLDFKVPPDEHIGVMNDLVDAGYTDSPTFGGWYIPQEVNNYRGFMEADGSPNAGTQQTIDYIEEVVAGNPIEAPFMIAPYFALEWRGASSAEAYAAFWDLVLSELADRDALIDIIALQDGFGTGKISSLLQVEPYFVELQAVVGSFADVELWSTLEVFDFSDGSDRAAGFDRVYCQWAAEENLVSKIIVFQSMNYLTPGATAVTGANALYNAYRDHVNEPVPVPDCAEFRQVPSTDVADIRITGINNRDNPTDVSCTRNATGVYTECDMVQSPDGTYFGIEYSVVDGDGASNGVNQLVDYSSEDSSVASCDPGDPEYCTVVARGNGSTTITLTSEVDPGVSTTLDVQVAGF